MDKYSIQIYGSPALLKAFVSDSGFPVHSDYEEHFWNRFPYMEFRKRVNDWVGNSSPKLNKKIFNLPEQYNEALSYFKKEDNEFKVGDIVICTKNNEESWKAGSGWEEGLIFKITAKDLSVGEESEFVCFGGKDGNGVYDKYLRKVTKEDIESLSTLPVINGWNSIPYKKGDDTLSYGCARLNTDWFREGVGNREISSLTLSNGVSINESQINKIRSVLNFVDNFKDELINSN